MMQGADFITVHFLTSMEIFTLTLFEIKTIYNNVLIDQILRGHLLWDTLYNSEQIICSSVQEV